MRRTASRPYRYLKRALRVVLVAAAMIAATSFLAPPGTASAAIGTNDYPYASGPADQVDPWNFYTRECTSFVAWRLNNDNGVAFHNYYGGVHWGNAENWDSAASAAGFAVDANPTRGSFAQFNPGVHGVGSYGHVAYVMQVSGGQVLVEDYNWVSYAYEQHWVSTAGLNFLDIGSPSGVAAGR